MDTSLKDMKTFVRNPLGVIGLFVTIVYLIAAMLLGYGLDKLQGCAERLPFIWFVILFPCVILFTFYKLVTEHSNKLYGPSDFQKDENFLLFANREEVQNKNLEKLKDEKTSVSFMTVSSNIEKKDKGVDDSSLMRSIILRDAVIVDRLSQKYEIQFYQNIELRVTRGSVVIDAYGKDKDKQYLVEIKILKSFTTEEIKSIVNRYVREVMPLNRSSHVKYIFAFYCKVVPEKDFVTEANNLCFYDDVDIVLFDKDCNIISPSA